MFGGGNSPPARRPAHPSPKTESVKGECRVAAGEDLINSKKALELQVIITAGRAGYSSAPRDDERPRAPREAI